MITDDDFEKLKNKIGDALEDGESFKDFSDIEINPLKNVKKESLWEKFKKLFKTKTLDERYGTVTREDNFKSIHNRIDRVEKILEDILDYARRTYYKS